MDTTTARKRLEETREELDRSIMVLQGDRPGEQLADFMPDPADAGSNRPLEKHGNPNALTLDIGTSKLSQGCSAQTCLVEIERHDGPAPAVTAHDLPRLVNRGI